MNKFNIFTFILCVATTFTYVDAKKDQPKKRGNQPEKGLPTKKRKKEEKTAQALTLYGVEGDRKLQAAMQDLTLCSPSKGDQQDVKDNKEVKEKKEVDLAITLPAELWQLVFEYLGLEVDEAYEYAIRIGHVGIIRFSDQGLIAQFQRINEEKNTTDFSELVASIAINHEINTLGLLLNTQISVEVQARLIQELFIFAAEYGNHSMLQLIVTNAWGKKHLALNHIQDAVKRAIRNNHFECVCYLLESLLKNKFEERSSDLPRACSGRDLDNFFEFGRWFNCMLPQCMMYSNTQEPVMRKKCVQLTCYLIEKATANDMLYAGSSIYAYNELSFSDGFSGLLYQAAARGYVEIIEFLFSKTKYRFCFTNQCIEDALTIAAKKSQTAVTAYLTRIKAELNKS